MEHCNRSVTSLVIYRYCRCSNFVRKQLLLIRLILSEGLINSPVHSYSSDKCRCTVVCQTASTYVLYGYKCTTVLIPVILVWQFLYAYHIHCTARLTVTSTGSW